MIKRDTLEFKIVSLIGLAGEMQTKDLFRLKYGNEYIRKVISTLKSDGYIMLNKLRKADGWTKNAYMMSFAVPFFIKNTDLISELYR